MRRGDHANLLLGITIMWAIGWFVALVILMPRAESCLAGMGLLLSLFGVVIVWELLLWLVPISCDERGCGGKVGHKWVGIVPISLSLRYVCKKCGQEWDGPVSIGLGGRDY